MVERKPVRRQKPQKQQNFDVKTFIAILAGAAVIFFGVVGIIRWWQKADLLDPWLKHHPRYNGQLERERAEAAAAARKSSPWLGAEAGVLDARILLQKAQQADLGMDRSREWFAYQQGPKARRPHRRSTIVRASEKAMTSSVNAVNKGTQHEESHLRTDKEATAQLTQWPSDKRWPVTLKDLVVAIPNHKLTEPQLKAGRLARSGMLTFVATNYTEEDSILYPRTEQEIWGYYPDAVPARSFYPGDDRAALTPFLAFKELGDSFKWMLYGDDDTVFFPSAALQLAATMDPDLPYFVTDNLWWSPLLGGAWHPNPQAPRCLPCGYSRNVSDAVGMSMVEGCPCTPADICGLEGGYDGAFAEKACGPPRSPSRTYSMHGGAGALISIGLLRAVDWTSMERCVNHQWSSGGDAFLTQCLWDQGFAHTSPDPVWHPQKLQMFDPSPAGLNPDDFILWKAGHVLGNLLQKAAGICSGLCKLELENTVSLHLRARRTGGSEEGAAAFIRAFSRLVKRLSGHDRKSEFSDVTNGKSEEAARRVDAEMDKGIQLLAASWEQSQSKNSAEELVWTSDFGSINADDSLRSGLADSIAGQILETISQIGKELTQPKAEDKPIKAWGLPGESIEHLVKEISDAAQKA